MPTNKQRREAARRHLERQLVRRQQQEARRRRFLIVASVVGTVVVIAAVVVVIVALGSGSDKKKTAADSPTVASPSSSTSAATFTAQETTGPCKYQTVDTKTGASQGAQYKDVGLPPDPKTTPTKTLTVDIQTNRGDIQLSLDGKAAPCNVQALAFLIHKKFFDNTPCPRVVNSGIYVVQCGSGGSTTAGGPTFTSPDENYKTADYSPGAIAMANTGQAHTGSSQFFVITKDSNKGLQKSYSLVGKVTKGLSIFQQVAAGGDDESSGAGGGAPKLSLIFQKVTITNDDTVGVGSTPNSQLTPVPSSAASSAG